MDLLNKIDLGSRRFIVWMVLALVVVIADQVTKWAIIQHLDYPDYYGVRFNDFIKLTHHRNYGAAWGFLANEGGWQRWFFVVLATGVSAVIGVWVWRIRIEGPTILVAGLSLVLGGAVGNLIDRAFLGYVTDFIQVKLPGVPFFDPFPSFNIADSAISVGAACLIIDALFFSGKAEQAAK